MEPFMNERAVLSIVAAMTIAACMAPLGFAQTGSTGALTGVTTDPSRAVIPGVEETLTNEATREVRTAVSNQRGNYSFGLLPPRSYRLEAPVPRFKNAVRSGIRV